MLRAPFPWFGDPLAYAKAHVHNGVLEIDGRGRIWRTAIYSHGHWTAVPRRRAENIGGKGYLRVSLWVPRERRLAQVMAHNLVWEVKVGPIPSGLELNHKDLNPANNTLDNLELVTKPENIQHSYAHGRTKPWTHAVEWRPGRMTLTREQVEQVRARRRAGAIYRVIADEFGISITHAHRLCAETGGGR